MLHVGCEGAAETPFKKARKDMTSSELHASNEVAAIFNPFLNLDYVIYRLTPLPPTSMITCFDDLMDFELVRY